MRPGGVSSCLKHLLLLLLLPAALSWRRSPKAPVATVGTVCYSGTMRNQVAHIAALFGRRLTLWFAVAWNLMFALWIAAGGLEVKTAYTAHDARMANLPLILTWAAVNFCVLIGWYTVATRTRKAAR